MKHYMLLDGSIIIDIAYSLGEGYICDQNHNILATATAKYFKQDINKILEDENKEDLGEEWIIRGR